MNKLPNCSQAFIPRSKIEDYLLNPSHCEGKSKAMFFSKFGYSLANGSAFYQSLRDLACESLIIQTRWMVFDQNDPKNIQRLITVIPVRSK